MLTAPLTTGGLVIDVTRESVVTARQRIVECVRFMNMAACCSSERVGNERPQLPSMFDMRKMGPYNCTGPTQL